MTMTTRMRDVEWLKQSQRPILDVIRDQLTSRLHKSLAEQDEAAYLASSIDAETLASVAIEVLKDRQSRVSEWLLILHERVDQLERQVREDQS